MLEGVQTKATKEARRKRLANQKEEKGF